MVVVEKDNFKDNLWKACDKLRNNMDPADTFTKDQHKGKKMGYIMANPPFNIKDYWHESLDGDAR